jgi:hypothetical protein
MMKIVKQNITNMKRKRDPYKVGMNILEADQKRHDMQTKKIQ